MPNLYPLPPTERLFQLLWWVLMAGLMGLCVAYAINEPFEVRLLEIDERFIAYAELNKYVMEPSQWFHHWTVGDYKYGRTMFLLAWPAAAIGHAIGQETGMVIGYRLFYDVLLVAGLLLASFSISRSWTYRVLMLVIVCTLPGVGYYLEIAKPENLQVFLFGLLVWHLTREKVAYSIIFLIIGALFGFKISVLPLVFVVSAFCKLRYLHATHWQLGLKNLRIMGLWAVYFLGAWYLANPITHWHAYLADTFLHTGHQLGDNVFQASPAIWRIFITDEVLHLSRLPLWYLAPLPLVVWLGVYVFRLWQQGHSFFNPGLIFLLIGFGLLAPVILKVSRLWDFYLLPGTFFLVAGIVYTLQHTAVESWPTVRSRFLATTLAIVSLVCIFSQRPVLFAGQVSHTLHRTSIPAFASKAEASALVMRQWATLPKPLSAVVDPYMLFPDSLPGVHITRHGYTLLPTIGTLPDVLVLNDSSDLPPVSPNGIYWPVPAVKAAQQADRAATAPYFSGPNAPYEEKFIGLRPQFHYYVRKHRGR